VGMSTTFLIPGSTWVQNKQLGKILVFMEPCGFASFIHAWCDFSQRGPLLEVPQHEVELRPKSLERTGAS
jgi:hypothetical protein